MATLDRDLANTVSHKWSGMDTGQMSIIHGSFFGHWKAVPNTMRQAGDIWGPDEVTKTHVAKVKFPGATVRCLLWLWLHPSPWDNSVTLMVMVILGPGVMFLLSIPAVFTEQVAKMLACPVISRSLTHLREGALIHLFIWSCDLSGSFPLLKWENPEISPEHRLTEPTFSSLHVCLSSGCIHLGRLCLRSAKREHYVPTRK